MVTPTDDGDGIASMNHTQKIPISLIKVKDKASVSVPPRVIWLVMVFGVVNLKKYYSTMIGFDRFLPTLGGRRLLLEF